MIHGKKPYIHLIGTPKGDLIKKLAKKYQLSYKDAYYYTQVFDYIFDILLRLGAEIYLKGILSVKVNVERKQSKRVGENKDFLTKAMKDKDPIYYNKYIKSKEIQQ